MSAHNVAIGPTGRTLSAEEVAAANADTVVINPKDLAARSKVPLQLIPPRAETLIAQAIAFGSRTKGYGDFNWRDKGIGLMTYLGAIMRHTNAVRSGEDIDPESGLPHVAHIAATACILMDAAKHGKLIEDRPGA